MDEELSLKEMLLRVSKDAYEESLILKGKSMAYAELANVLDKYEVTKKEEKAA